MSDRGESSRPARTPKPRPAPLLPPLRSSSSSAKVLVNDHQTAEAQAGSYGTFRGEGRAASPPRRMSLFEYIASPHSPIVQVRHHCQQQWLAIVLTILLLGFTLYFVLGTSAPPVGSSCVTPLGTYLGESNGVVAYSNCNLRFFGNNMDHYVRVGVQRVATGTKWRSIEYVRRYWILTQQLVLPTVASSDRLLDLHEVRVVSKPLRDATVPLLKFHNLPKPLAEVTPEGPQSTSDTSTSAQGGGASAAFLDATAADSARKGRGQAGKGERVNPNGVSLSTWVLNRQTARPQEGDIIAYDVQKPNMTHGHAAVVVRVIGPFRRFEDMSPRMQAFVRAVPANEAGDASPEHSSPIPLKTLREEQRDFSHASAPPTSNKLGTQAGILLYQVFVAEQNIDNWYWADELSKEDTAGLEKQNGKEVGETSMFTSAFRVGVPHASSPHSNRTGDDESEDALFVRRTFSRVLLVREYYPSHTYYLEDSAHNRILGWIRPGEQRP